MSSTTQTRGLRRLLFAGGLTATAVAALLSPDWSSVLKAQGYYGDVDLRIEVTHTSPAISGEQVVFTIRVWNNGPDTAHRVRTVVAAPGLQPITTLACPSGSYPSCNLADTLEPGQQTAYAVALLVTTGMRNHLQFSASVASDDSEIAPGDEIAVLKAPIVVNTDLRSEIACARRSLVAADRFAHCSIRFRNQGSHQALLPRLQARVAGTASPVQWLCQASLQSLCNGAVQGASAYTLTPPYLAPGDSVTFYADIRPNGAAPLVALDADALLNPNLGETDVQPGNNASSLLFEPSLFVDGFEPAAD